ncbi:MAG: efflux RND transporter permease subunit, partial [Bdellovibrionales bacterium]|nr:efflux RND transporter permease subunit [Bdellovibrionales bacterium]
DQNRIVQYNGEPTVTLRVLKDTHSDTIDLKGQVLKVVGEFNKTLPQPLVATIFADGPAFIEKQIEVLNRNGLLGLALVILILILLLNWRTSVMTVLGLPVAYLGTLVVLQQMGIAIDLISIIGMILVIGILVDDAIIVSERYVENLQEGMVPREAAFRAASDLIVPVTGTVLTTIVAFAPMILIKSEISTVLFAVPLVIIVSLIFSWLESFFILPNHLAHFVKVAPKQTDASWFNRVRRGYERMLGWALKGRYPIILVLLAIFGVSGYWAAKKLRHDFNLQINLERVTVFAALKQSASLEETMKQLVPLQETLLTLPKTEVETVYSRIGSVWMDGRMQEGYRFARFDLYLDRNTAYPTKLRDKVQERTEKLLTPFRESGLFEKIYSKASQENQDKDKGSMVTVQIRGGEEVDFHEIEKALGEEALKVPGITEMVDDPERYRTSWQFVADPKSLLQHNLNPAELANQLRGLFVPDELIETRISGERVFIYTQNLRERPPRFDELSTLSVVSPRGIDVPLRFLGLWKQKTALNRIQHLNGRRELKVDFKFDSDMINSTTIKGNLKASLEGVQKLFPSYDISVVDTNEEEAKNRA